MQIVIDIPEVFYEYCKAQTDATEIQLAIANGTSLPKGHGRLIDADKLPVCAKLITPDGTSVYIPAVPILKIVNAPTIIEADKEDNK